MYTKPGFCKNTCLILAIMHNACVRIIYETKLVVNALVMKPHVCRVMRDRSIGIPYGLKFFTGLNFRSFCGSRSYPRIVSSVSILSKCCITVLNGRQTSCYSFPLIFSPPRLQDYFLLITLNSILN